MQNIFFSFFLSRCKMKLNAFLPKLCACISGMAEGPCPRVDLRRPGLRAGQCQGFALPRPARTAPGGSRPPSRAPEVALCRLRAHLGAPGPCPGGRLQVRRAGPAGASPHARPPRRSPSPDLLCDGDLHGREKGPWARGWPAAPPPSGLRPPGGRACALGTGAGEPGVGAGAPRRPLLPPLRSCRPAVPEGDTTLSPAVTEH